MKSSWQKLSLDAISIINPSETLKKGEIAKKIPMDVIVPFQRDVPYYELAEFNGGTKFRNGDTIMARITPCLENGKIAFVDTLNNNEVGFGSTEYIVFRAIKGISNENFLYYLICSPIVREPAIKSMVGSSGRQRVQTDVLRKLNIYVPPVEEQEKIGGLLKSIDDKISINRKINNNLQQQASCLFDSWFIDLDPFGSSISTDWVDAVFGDIADIGSGKRPPNKNDKPTVEATVPIVGAASIMGYTTEANHSDKILVTGRVGTHGVIQRFNSPCWTSDNTLVVTSPYYEYVYQILKRIDYSAMNRGSTQPLITQGDLSKVSVILPSETVLNEFENIVGALMAQVAANNLEVAKLSALRDALLPKLMSGEIDVSNIEI